MVPTNLKNSCITNHFKKVPGVATYETFASRFGSFVMGTYPDKVTKRRARRLGEVNPTSVLVGIRLKDELGILSALNHIS